MQRSPRELFEGLKEYSYECMNILGCCFCRLNCFAKICIREADADARDITLTVAFNSSDARSSRLV